VGDPVKIIAGIFAGTDTTVVRLEPASKRIAVLITLLGDSREILIDPREVDLPEADPRHRAG
jgi:transcription antitermination factor NusG